MTSRRALPVLPPASSPQNENLLAGVEVMVTGACNNRCGYCGTGWEMIEGAEAPEVSREALQRDLALAYERGARRVTFAGGEPTLRRDLGDIIEDARLIGYEGRSIFTHARVASSRGGLKWLGSMSVTSFHVSIQGGTAEAHDASVGVRGAFEQTTLGVRNLKTLGKPISVNGVLTIDLLATLEQFTTLMCDLRPNEIGFDAVRSHGAFDAGRASFVELAPALSRYGVRIARALETMVAAGLKARATGLPPCLVPGAEHLVGQEIEDVETRNLKGEVNAKYEHARGHVKAPSCLSCVYERGCPGLDPRYVETYGFDELRPSSIRAPRTSGKKVAGPDGPLTFALRRLFVRDRADAGVREVCVTDDGAHELFCYGPRGDVTVVLTESANSKAYARVGRFSVAYLPDPQGTKIDLRIVDGIVQLLRRAEPGLPRAAQ